MSMGDEEKVSRERKERRERRKEGRKEERKKRIDLTFKQVTCPCVT